MNGLDLLVLLILAGSLLLGLMRGLVKELFSLAAWVLAFLGARALAAPVAPWLPLADAPGMRHALALVVVFIAILVAASLAGSVLAGVVRWVGLGGYDRFTGMLFGLLRAGVALLFLALVAGMTALPHTPLWQGALARPYLESAARAALPWLPRDVARYVHYS